MSLIANNQEHFQTNSAIYNINTNNNHLLHRPTANLSCFQKNAYHASIKIFNSLPSGLTNVTNKKAQFKAALK
jgi:hypothetical protein